MSRPGTLAGRIVGLPGRARGLLAIAALALIAVLVLVLTQLDQPGEPGGVASLQVQAAVRNTAGDEQRFVTKAGGAAGDRLEYSLVAINDGKATLSDVAITFAAPPSWGSSLVRGSCRLRRPGADFVSCSDRLRGPDLTAERLRAGERLEVRVAYTLDPPACRTPSIGSQVSSDSAETAATNPVVATVSYSGLSGRLPRCGTKLAQLLSAVPAATRATCSEWPGLGSPVLARVQCVPKQGARYAVYLQYRSPTIAAQVYGLIADRERPRACGSFASGTGTARDGSGERVVTCSTGTGGVGHLTWYHDGTSVFAYADGTDGDLGELLDWWRTNG